MTRPLLVGITGGIGSGKSTVCQIFEVLGVPIYYADDRGKYLLSNNSSLVESVKREFGAESYSKDGQLNRSYLADVAFSNPTELKKLNELVHPAVATDFAEWVQSHQNHPYVLKEAALLFETESYKSLDKVICVFASKKTRVERVLLRDLQRTHEQVDQIIGQQTSDGVRRELADYSIQNDSDSLLIPQVMKVHMRILDSASD
ncbi:dephospho-CoA kinase [Roseivirga sp. E12]|uniref:dephospho-CoA kinase n=1 Tax=Roseivirga sp. E12 TaxID=2819237 RepID=UPI001ABD403A|nr:dephospho-CoA kinase [Roseivirga sp. E12]MBO3700371.1 dephospho-CoA kinase [Roseivirga sp. E12]